jgi:2-amino-4-hydroxy-6-hydroxymethyldihydropteridine diphosphokinase
MANNKVEIVYLLLGSNIGDKRANILKAKRLITERVGAVQRTSGLYQTQAWGDTEQEDYYNQALEVRTYHSPDTVLRNVMDIERELGRVRTKQRNEPRIIDIDILFYGNKVLRTKDLIIPHPRFHERNFAMLPMMDINGDYIHPTLMLAIDELYFDSKDESEVLLLD